MSEELSSQLSPSSELPAKPAGRSKSWRFLSLLLIVGGIGLITAGGWIYLQQIIEASKPPPARIVEVSLAELEQTLTPQPTAADAVSTATPLPGNTPTPNNSTGDRLVLAANPTPTPQTPATDMPEPPPTEPAEDLLSLADNPLPMVQDEAAPPQAGSVELEAPPAQPIPADEIPGPPLTRLVAESISLDAEVIPVGWAQIIQNGEPLNVWTVADYAAGWHKNSTLPGQGGNVVLSGHHNIKGEVFRYIVDLEPGASVTLYDEAGQQYNYIIEDKFIVKDKGEPEAVRMANAKWIGPFNEERLTMVTCWPYTNNTHRVIVIAKPAETAQTASQ